MYLVDDKHLIASDLRRDTCLLHNLLDMLHRVVARCVEFEDVERALVVERLAALTFIASLSIGCGVLAVDCLGKNTCASGFSHSARPAEQVGMSQLATLDGILDCCG